MLTGCYENILKATDYDQGYTSCFCNYGVPYLDCFYSRVATGTCASYYFGSGGTSLSGRKRALSRELSC